MGQLDLVSIHVPIATIGRGSDPVERARRLNLGEAIVVAYDRSCAAGCVLRLYLSALLIGVVAGSRTFTPAAAVSWAARLRWLHLSGTPLGFLGALAAPFIFTLLSIGELIVDKLPNTPSRKAPRGFIARIVSGAFWGAALSLAGGGAFGGLIAGGTGAVVGTMGFSQFRTRLTKAFGGRDLPAALIEDACAIAAAVWIVTPIR